MSYDYATYRTYQPRELASTHHTYAGHYTLTRLSDGFRVKRIRFFLDRQHMEVKLAQYNAQQPKDWHYEAAPMPVYSIGQDEIDRALRSEAA
jgi:hypothetical protein